MDDFNDTAAAYRAAFGEGLPLMLLPAASAATWARIARLHVEAGEPVSLDSLERLAGIPNDVPPGACV